MLVNHGEWNVDRDKYENIVDKPRPHMNLCQITLTRKLYFGSNKGSYSIGHPIYFTFVTTISYDIILY